MAKITRRSPIALAVLALLYEEPMHPYRMQHLIKKRGKDEVINVRQRTSLYQTIDRLARAGLIRVRETLRNEHFPERTVYELTAQGRETTGRWLRDMLATPAHEFSEFPAALAFLPLLSPAEARHQLEKRVVALEKTLAQMDEQLRQAAEAVPRLFLLEGEYLRAQVHTELAWVRAVVAELHDGRLTWSDAWLREIAIRLEAEESRSDRGWKGEDG